MYSREGNGMNIAKKVKQYSLTFFFIYDDSEIDRNGVELLSYLTSSREASPCLIKL